MTTSDLEMRLAALEKKHWLLFRAVVVVAAILGFSLATSAGNSGTDLICLSCGGSGWLLRAIGPIRDWFLKRPLCKEGVT